MPDNLLSRETSPYLLQHADNPVAWRAWSESALAEARGLDKPILLSIGYAACHWCHVMAHESFEDPDIAAVMNEGFVNIKVDREERPDLDAIYQAGLGLLGEQGGWPLTMFLTPEGRPFWGGTYFPPEQRWGRPGFRQILDAVAATWRERRRDVEDQATALHQAIGKHAAGLTPGDVPPELMDRAAAVIARAVDPVWGGLAGAPKFPHAPVFELLFRAYRRTGQEAYADAAHQAVTRMAQGGIYDHLGGGFARYSTDEQWLVPHFEKMLYDNAALIDLLVLTWQDRPTPLYATRIVETIGWVLEEMVVEGGGLASSLDADSEGEEGRFYVWSAAEIDQVLGAGAALFRQFYDVSEEGNWEGKIILNRRHQDALADEPTEQRLAEARARLRAARSHRARPAWDDKVLADWNGLMIAALASAAAVFERGDWMAAAKRAFAFVRDRMSEGDRLLHSWRAGEARHAGTLDDYAAMIRAALALAELTGDPVGLERATAWSAVVNRHFDDSEGGWYFTPDDGERLIVRTRTAFDGATPAGAGLMIGNLARLYLLTGDAAWRDRAEAALAAYGGEVARNVVGAATLLNEAETLRRLQQIVIAGDPGAADTAALKRAVLSRALPGRLLTIVPPGASLPAGHPAAGKGPVAGRATAYVCESMSCRPPVSDPAALASMLD